HEELLLRRSAPAGDGALRRGAPADPGGRSFRRSLGDAARGRAFHGPPPECIGPTKMDIAHGGRRAGRPSRLLPHTLRRHAVAAAGAVAAEGRADDAGPAPVSAQTRSPFLTR